MIGRVMANGWLQQSRVPHNDLGKSRAMKDMKDMLVSGHYLRARGRLYSDQQRTAECIGYKLQSEFFKPFISPQDCVLDFGCGKGGLARQLQCRRIDGFDVNLYALTFARKHYRETFSEYHMPLVGVYDVVVSNHCLEHIPSPLSALRFVHSWLKPNGIAVFIVPHDCITRYQSKFDIDDPDHHLYTWTPRTLCNLFKETGFEVGQCSVLKSAWHPKLFRIHKLPWIGQLSRRMLCYVLKRPQILCIARKPNPTN